MLENIDWSLFIQYLTAFIALFIGIWSPWYMERKRLKAEEMKNLEDQKSFLQGVKSEWDGFYSGFES